MTFKGQITANNTSLLLLSILKADSRPQVDVFNIDVRFGDGLFRSVRLKSESEEREPQMSPVLLLQRRRVRHYSQTEEEARWASGGDLAESQHG